MTDTTDTGESKMTDGITMRPFANVTATRETDTAFYFSAARTSDGKAVTICIPKPDDREGA